METPGKRREVPHDDANANDVKSTAETLQDLPHSCVSPEFCG